MSASSVLTGTPSSTCRTARGPRAPRASSFGTTAMPTSAFGWPRRRGSGPSTPSWRRRFSRSSTSWRRSRHALRHGAGGPVRALARARRRRRLRRRRHHRRAPAPLVRLALGATTRLVHQLGQEELVPTSIGLALSVTSAVGVSRLPGALVSSVGAIDPGDLRRRRVDLPAGAVLAFRRFRREAAQDEADERAQAPVAKLTMTKESKSRGRRNMRRSAQAQEIDKMLQQPQQNALWRRNVARWHSPRASFLPLTAVTLHGTRPLLLPFR